MESPKIICKASLGKELRKVTFPGSPTLTYGVLRSTLASLFHLIDFRLQYKDEDGDAIILSSEEELNDALHHLASARTDSDTIILRVFLDEATPRVDNELREAPQNSGEVDKNASTDQDSNNTNDYEFPPLDQVVNNIQDMVENLFSQISTRFDKDISSGLADLGILGTSKPSVESHSARDETVDEHPTSSEETSNHTDNSAATCPKFNSSCVSQAGSDTSIIDSSNGTSSLSSSITSIGTAELGSDANRAKRGVPNIICTGTINSTCSPRGDAVLASNDPIDDAVLTTDTSSDDVVMTVGTFSNGDLVNTGSCLDNVSVIANSSSDDVVVIGSSTLSPVSDSAAATDSDVSSPGPQDSAGLIRNVHCAICNSCEHVIVGIRRKCINCPDFDLCDECFQHASTGHPNHTFMTVPKPGDPEIRAPPTSKHVGIRCDVCSLSILGVRYKCGNCPDFDLCGNCEASPFNDHDPSHVFIKISRPATRQIPFAVSLLPSFYLDTDRESTRSSSYCRRRCPKRAQDDQDNAQPNAQTQKRPFVATSSKTPLGASSGISCERSLETSSEISCETSLEISSEMSCETSLETFSEISSETSLETCSRTSLGASSENSRHNVPPIFRARFVEDVNTPDGTVVAPRAQFQKIWKMCNIGDVSWPESTVLQFTGGHPMFKEGINQPRDGAQILVGAVEPGKHLNLCVDLQAPPEPGRYIAYWRLVDGNGVRFGHRLWCDVIVEAPKEASDEASPMTYIGPSYSLLSTTVTSRDQAAEASLVDARDFGTNDHSQPSTESAAYGGSSPTQDMMETDEPSPQDNQEDTLFAEELDLLSSMGFNDREFNVQLLLAEDGNVRNVVDALIIDTEHRATGNNKQNA